MTGSRWQAAGSKSAGFREYAILKRREGRRTEQCIIARVLTLPIDQYADTKWEFRLLYSFLEHGV